MSSTMFAAMIFSGDAPSRPNLVFKLFDTHESRPWTAKGRTLKGRTLPTLSVPVLTSTVTLVAHAHAHAHPRVKYIDLPTQLPYIRKAKKSITTTFSITYIWYNMKKSGHKDLPKIFCIITRPRT